MFIPYYIPIILPNKNKKKTYFFWKYIDAIGSDIKNYLCMYCFCNDRTRHIFMYLDYLNIWDRFKNSRVLHFAPEMELYKRIAKMKPMEYVISDIETEKYEFIDSNILFIDATNIKYSDNYFNFIIINHVLEHIKDYKKALTELARVLDNDGYLLIQTPYSNILESNFEDDGINTDDRRSFFYGQNDHVRLFSKKKLFKDILDLGFNYCGVKHREIFNGSISGRYGVNPKEELFLFKKI